MKTSCENKLFFLGLSLTTERVVKDKIFMQFGGNDSVVSSEWDTLILADLRPTLWLWKSYFSCLGLILGENAGSLTVFTLKIFYKSSRRK